MVKILEGNSKFNNIKNNLKALSVNDARDAWRYVGIADWRSFEEFRNSYINNDFKNRYKDNIDDAEDDLEMIFKYNKKGMI